MRVVVNPAANLTRAVVEHYRIEVAPLYIMVDGVAKDGRDPIALRDVDTWVRDAKTFPYAVGTSAAEFVGIFSLAVRDDPEILAVLSSRKLIKSHSAATAAAKAVRERIPNERIRIFVIDSMMTDTATGLLAMAAAEAAKEGQPAQLVAETLEAIARRGCCIWTPATLDNLVRGGRATFLKAWIADALNVKPVVGFVDGDVKSVGRISGSADRVVELGKCAIKAAGRSKRVWLGVAHGAVPDEAVRLEEYLRRALPVEYVYRQPLSPGVYLYGGPGSLAVTVLPMDAVGFPLPVPPSFSERAR